VTGLGRFDAWHRLAASWRRTRLRRGEQVAPGRRVDAGEARVGRGRLPPEGHIERIGQGLAAAGASAMRGAEKNDDRRMQQHRQQHEPHDGRLGRIRAPLPLPYRAA